MPCWGMNARTDYWVASKILEGLRNKGFERSVSDSCVIENGDIAIRVSMVNGLFNHKYRAEVRLGNTPMAVFQDTSAEDVVKRAIRKARYMWIGSPSYMKEMLALTKDSHSHYKRDVSKLDYIDVYRIIDLYQLHDPCFQHALKKILVPGERGHKDLKNDIQDIIDTMRRKQEMMREDEK